MYKLKNIVDVDYDDYHTEYFIFDTDEIVFILIIKGW